MEDKSISFENNLNTDDYEYLKSLDSEFYREFIEDDYSTYFTEQDYANLQRNLVLFKEGNREATEFIIHKFHKILHAYAHFIVLHKVPHRKVVKDGKVSYRIHPSILSFIKLFSSKQEAKERRKIGDSNVKLNSELIYKLFSKFEYGDIYNELVLALLHMAEKYKIITDPKDPNYKVNGTFHLYVKKCFHFEAYYFLTRLTKDPMMKYDVVFIGEEDYINNEEDQVVNEIGYIEDEKALMQYDFAIHNIDRELSIKNSKSLTLKENNMDAFDDESLNFNWITGAACSEAFQTLSSYEREILVLYYSKNQTEETLANLFGCSRAAIGNHRRKAVKKLKKAVEEKERRNLA